jgi:hypothetical protein
MNFVELWLGISPDAGTGSLELLCILAVLVGLVVFLDRVLVSGSCILNKQSR